MTRTGPAATPPSAASPCWTSARPSSAAGARRRRSWARPSRSPPPSSARAMTRSPPTSCCATRSGRAGPVDPDARTRPGHRPLGRRGHPDDGGPLDVHGGGLGRPGHHLAPPRADQDPGGDRRGAGPGGGRAAVRAGRRRGAGRAGRAAVLAAARRAARRGPPRRAPGSPPPWPRTWTRVLAGHPLRELVTVRRAVAVAGGAGAGVVRLLVRVLPAFGGRRRRDRQAHRQRHLPHRRPAAAGDRRDGLRRGLPAAHPPDRHDLPQGPQQHPVRGPARCGRAVGDRLPGRRPRRDPPRPGHPGGLRRTSWHGPASWAWRSRWTSRCSAPRTTPGWTSTPSGSTTARTAPSPTRRTRRRSTRTSTPSPSTRTWTA